MLRKEAGSSHHEAVKELLQEKNPEAAQEAAQTLYGYINTERTADIAKFLVDRTNGRAIGQCCVRRRL